LQVNAGHGINYMNVLDIRRVPQLEVLNIGHSIVSRSMYVGLSAAVNEMVRLLNVPERPPGASWIPD
jgi:pyridoxine 5-phosphate synthase